MSKENELVELSRKLSVLKEQKSELDTESREWTEKRDGLNTKFQNIRREISELRQKRDQANLEVRGLKQKRDNNRTRMHEEIMEIKKLRQEIEVLLDRKSSRSLQMLEMEFEDVEWKIQTTSLSLQEEKELVERVKQIELQLATYRKLENTHQKTRNSKAELAVAKTESNLCHDEMTKIAAKSQEIHQKLLAKLEESKRIKEEADQAHHSLLQAREKAKPLKAEIEEITNQINLLKKEKRNVEETLKKQGEEAIIDKIEKDAREKLKHGGKLSWEEFKVLAERGVGAED